MVNVKIYYFLYKLSQWKKESAKAMADFYFWHTLGTNGLMQFQLFRPNVLPSQSVARPGGWPGGGGRMKKLWEFFSPRRKKFPVKFRNFLHLIFKVFVYWLTKWVNCRAEFFPIEKLISCSILNLHGCSVLLTAHCSPPKILHFPPTWLDIDDGRWISGSEAASTIFQLSHRKGSVCVCGTAGQIGPANLPCEQLFLKENPAFRAVSLCRWGELSNPGSKENHILLPRRPKHMWNKFRLLS